MAKQKIKMILIGFDGCSWNVLNPLLKRGIGMAYVDTPYAKLGSEISIKDKVAKVTKFPFNIESV